MTDRLVKQTHVVGVGDDCGRGAREGRHFMRGA